MIMRLALELFDTSSPLLDISEGPLRDGALFRIHSAVREEGGSSPLRTCFMVNDRSVS